MNAIMLGGSNPAAFANSFWYITSIAAWLNYRASNTALQSLTAGMAATAITLSTTSVSVATSMDANSFVATITVTATGGTYAGVLTLGGADAANFALKTVGHIPAI